MERMPIDPMICTLDLSRASRGSEKIGSDEYFRALKAHKSLKEIGPRQSKLSRDSQYAIDKVVRERLKEGSFGYDNSQLLILESQLRKEPENKRQKMNEMLLEKLEAPTERSRKISYEDWLRLKSAEDRLKKQLMIPIYEYEWEQELLERQDKEMKKSESTKRVTEWFKKKQAEFLQSCKEKKKEKSIKKKHKIQQRREAEIVYRQWLKKSLHKMRSEQKMTKENKKIQEQKKKELEMEELRKKQEAEVKYNEWLHTHKHQPKKKRETNTRQYKPLKRAYGLAYSLNKKKQPSLKFSFDDISESEDSHIIQEISGEQSDEEPEVRPPVTGEFKIENNKMFEEDLSCIQPNAQQPRQPPRETDSEIESENESEYSIDSDMTN